MSIVVATCDETINEESESKRYSYNRINNAGSFVNIFNQLDNKSFEAIQAHLMENNGYEIKSWDDHGIFHYNPQTLRDTKGRRQKLRHSLNDDGSYYKTEKASLEEIKDKTNAQGVFVITPDHQLYYYDDAFFGPVEEFFVGA